MKKMFLIMVLYILFIPSLQAFGNKVSYFDIEYIYEDSFRPRLRDSSEYLIQENYVTKIDLLRQNEFETLQKSYLNNGKETWLYLGEGYVTTKGEIVTASENSTHYLKGIVYVGKETSVVGSGSKSRPYKFLSSNDIYISKIYVKNVDGYNEESYQTPIKGNDFKYTLYNYDCGHRAFVEWDENTYELLFSEIRIPVSCVLWFKEEYK